MLCADWLSYYQAICYSPPVAKSADVLGENFFFFSKIFFILDIFYQLVGFY